MKIKRLFSWVLRVGRKCSTFISCIRCKLPYDSTWWISGKLIVVRPNFFHKKSIVKIGSNFQAQADIHWNSFGIIQPNVINVRTPGAEVIMGNNVGISGSTISASEKIEIGDNVLIGSGCVICDSDAHPIKYTERNDNSKTKTSPIKIESDVFIGARCLILKGVHIGKGSVVGAGSVVTHDIPPMQIWCGNPARFVKDITL